VSGRLRANSTAAATEITNSTPSERSPGEPSASRIVRASGGSAGARSGFQSVTATTQPTYIIVSTKPGMNAPL
jgi:hypothetical protein